MSEENNDDIGNKPIPTFDPELIESLKAHGVNVGSLSATAVNLGDYIPPDDTFTAPCSRIVSIDVVHHINEHLIQLPQRASLKELYFALADQVEAFDPNGACMLRTQANCTDNW